MRNTLIDIYLDFWNNYLMPAIAALTAFFIANWDQISAYLNAAWQIIIGIIQIAWGIVSGIIKVGLAILAGDWTKAWEAIKQTFSTVWRGIESIFNGALFFVKEWGKSILHAIVSPFEEAWRKAEELVGKIKGALDFTQRHSPSVIDIINNGVKLANRAMENLEWNSNITPNYAAASVMNGAQNSNVNQISISLAGAYIGSEFAATSIGEKIGDSIIRKLQQNVKF
jgi:phage-related protein